MNSGSAQSSLPVMLQTVDQRRPKVPFKSNQQRKWMNAKPGGEADRGKEVKAAFATGQKVLISGEGFTDLRGNAVENDEGVIKRFVPASPDNFGFNKAVVRGPDGNETNISWREGAEVPIRDAATKPQTMPVAQATKPAAASA